METDVTGALSVADIIDSLEALMFEAIGMTAVALSSASAGELTLSQWRALVVLGRADASRVSDIADAIGMSLPSTSRLIRRLERRAAVTTERDEVDRRSTLVRLTDKGHQLRAAVVKRRRELMEAALSDFSLDPRQNLVPGLVAIAAAFEAYH
jgi:MarR family transcriptional regulator, organic hydroperoxide resistance regulator